MVVDGFLGGPLRKKVQRCAESKVRGLGGAGGTQRLDGTNAFHGKLIVYNIVYNGNSTKMI